ncbi:MAG: hypothetical protein ACRDLB_12370, partial [Actinomycetota bacterium]
MNPTADLEAVWDRALSQRRGVVARAERAETQAFIQRVQDRARVVTVRFDAVTQGLGLGPLPAAIAELLGDKQPSDLASAATRRW